MLKKFKLILCRHGESILNKQNKVSEWSDTNLNYRGISQSFFIGQKLLNHNLIPDTIYTSQLKRTKQTSSIIKYFLKKDVHTISSWILNERYYGILEGKNQHEAIIEYGAYNIHKIKFCPVLLFGNAVKNE